VALTSRGKAVVAGGAVVAVLGGGIGALALSGNTPDVAEIVNAVVPGDDVQPCPLTGETLPGDAAPPDRPVLAVKVENTPDAQPLAGLEGADIVYEEVVEGGITRFVVLFHCDDANRVGPVRSIRSTDPGILAPFSEHPLLAFSGGSKGVRTIVEDAGMTTLDEDSATKAFERDDDRIVPHNLFTETKALWAKALKRAEGEPAPAAAFIYSDEVPAPSKKARVATVVFSGLATAEWHWAKGRWVRYLEGSPMLLENGEPITTDNVVIQVVKTTESDFQDVSGYPSPEVDLTGSGKAWVLRDGKLIVGKWERSDEADFTTFLTKSGEEIALRPGTTYVELAPKGMFDAEISFG
jgi:hypothetical protein